MTRCDRTGGGFPGGRRPRAGRLIGGLCLLAVCALGAAATPGTVGLHPSAASVRVRPAPIHPARFPAGTAAISGTALHARAAPAAIDGTTLRGRAAPAAINGAAVRRPRA
jgi:hypothetical protein